MENKEDVARKFWKNKTSYPKYEFIKQRRLIEVNYLVPIIEFENIKSMLDLGCGDGALIKCLKELTNIKQFYAYDFAVDLMKDVPAIKKNYDCYFPTKLPKVDMIVFSGVMPYLFDETIIHRNLKEFDAKLIYIKMPCSMTNEDIVVNKYSDSLLEDYSSIYRTVENVKEILTCHFKITGCFQIYPDEIESKFGTKQMVFICRKID